MFLKRISKGHKGGTDIGFDINICHINNLTEKEIHALAGKTIREVNAMTGYVVEPVCNTITCQLADIMYYVDVVRLEEKNIAGLTTIYTDAKSLHVGEMKRGYRKLSTMPFREKERLLRILCFMPCLRIWLLSLTINIAMDCCQDMKMAFLYTMSGIDAHIAIIGIKKGGRRMGLDMYIYHVNKINEEEARKLTGKTMQEAEEMARASGTHYTIADVSEEATEEIADIMDYVSVVNMKERYLDMDKVKELGIVPKEAKFAGVNEGDGFLSLTFYSTGSGTKEVKLTEKEEEMCMSEECRDFYVFRQEEVMYWENRRDIQSLIHDGFDMLGKHIENVFYYNMTDIASMIQNLTDGIVTEPEDGILVYHEWY